ncbi:MAG: ribosome biogenesis factor YjgA [Steroidobacteraceae bacterium]
MNDTEDGEPHSEYDGPSKSARKREALARQKLGARLTKLKNAELATLDLPELLMEALVEARRISAHGALARQHQYVGRLMREIDVDALEKALARLPSQQNVRAKMRR